MKCLKKLIALYAKVFDADTFDEEKLRVLPSRVEALKKEFLAIRAFEKRKLSTKEIIFETAFASE